MMAYQDKLGTIARKTQRNGVLYHTARGGLLSIESLVELTAVIIFALTSTTRLEVLNAFLEEGVDGAAAGPSHECGGSFFSFYNDIVPL